MGKLSLTKFSVAHSLTQAGLSLPARVRTVLQTRAENSKSPNQKTSQISTNKALSMESFLYWLKPVAEIKENKGKKQPLGGMLSALLVMSVQTAAGCWRHIGLLETHCLPVLTRHTNNPRCGLLLTLVWAEMSAQTHTPQFSCALTFVQ